jgi:hypothetical protein
MAEVISTLKMDRAEPLGNSDDGTGRRALHVKNLANLVSEKYDGIFAAYPTATTEIYTYKLGLATVATVTVTYTDATKDVFVSAVRT